MSLNRCLIPLLVLGAIPFASAQPLPLPQPTQAKAQPDPWDPRLGGRLRVAADRRIRDPLGRHVLLRGVNAGKKSGDLLPPHSAEDVASLVKATGINFVRLYVSWRGIEPTPGVYDATYLNGIATQVKRWNAQRVYVLIDMHQDLWGGSFMSHGAPNWATLGGASTVKAPTGPWQLRYADPAVWRSFEALWSNRPVPATGKGLQDHLAGAWVALARRLRGRPGVVGYDLLNEPFFGAEVPRELGGILRKALRPAAKVGLRATARASLRGLVHHLAPSPGRLPVVNPFRLKDSIREAKKGFKVGLDKASRDPKLFRESLAAIGPANTRFAARLSRFYTRVGGAVQAVDPRGLMFVEPMALTGIGVPSRMPRPRLRNLVYAPHLYDAFVDSGQPWDGQPQRVQDALHAHRQEAKRLGAPLVLGEWGNAHRQAGLDGFLTDMAAIVNRAGVGAAYWDHEPGDEANKSLSIALGPYPRRVAGILRTFTARPGHFVTIYAPQPSAGPTVLVVPKGAFPQGVRVSTPTRIHASWRYDAERQLLLLRCPPGSKGVMIVVVTPAKPGAPTSGITSRELR
ncbi:MAG: cellulase family glycosylhydrolase [Planctomycetes bacterium]|nr:cellulase family glycosylhydrolase [Planctomycetota bacterium]